MLRGTLGEVLRVVEVFLEELLKRVRVKEVYLFGSYAKEMWVKTSDIDLVVVSPDFRGIPYLERLDLINEVQWRLNIKPFIEAVPLTPEELEVKLKESAVIRDASKYWISVDRPPRP